MRFLTIAVLSLSLSACITSSPEKATVLEGKGEAAVIAKIDGYSGLSRLYFTSYSEKTALNKPDKPPSGMKMFEVNLLKSKQGYIFSNPHGNTSYYLAHGTIQTNWAGCFNKKTFKFDVKDDQITHLGTLKLKGVYPEVTQRIRAEGDERLRLQGAAAGTVAKYYPDLDNNPEIIPPTKQDLADARTYLKSVGMEFDVPVVAAETQEISFSARNAIFGSSKKCS